MHNVQNAMFAAALAYSLGIDLENIRHGLRTFNTNFFQAPGRLNVFDEHPFKVILDYAHNPAAVRVMCDLVDRLDVEGRRILVLAAPGDRRDQDITDIGTIAAGHFDHYICRSDDNPRGRAPGDVPRMLAEALKAAGVADSAIEQVPDEQAATSAALSMAATGDLVVIFGDSIKRTWKQIIYFSSEKRSDEATATTTFRLPSLADQFSLDEDVQLIRDERGVRIAREESD